MSSGYPHDSHSQGHISTNQQAQIPAQLSRFSPSPVDMPLPDGPKTPHHRGMSRLDQLRAVRDFIDREIAAELGPRCHGAIEQAAELYGVTVTDVLGRGRTRKVSQARQAAAWLMRREGRSLRDISKALAYEDHSTALYACKKVDSSPGVKALLLGLAS